ncbi:Holliday junction branch migration protein RuvA [Hirschia baltica]|uniref:Holliday junction branch migration complex subunit RuvA n=1 Tax=Hirschia baltica (strain ATCC 49814 / DSM 5838 / IFAM 1418) TaxID=582402 RepID=C6XNF0_HIRBI|nr:Holliday junction branch migration protein RuvA [Hirschia baltica]ACT60094.1 Holliday junction DNA helicase RuvA [Hirschia baltica ATCC 49814]
MIARLKGIVAATGDGQALIDVNGVGYVLFCGGRTLARLTIGRENTVFVETQMSENAIKLYGFETAEDRAWFSRLQDAPGVGAKAALNILDALTPAQLMDAIVLGDAASVQRAHGVGKKLAERVVSEFKDKPPPAGLFSVSFAPSEGVEGLASTSTASTGSRAAAASALTNLGYQNVDAQRAVAVAAKELGEDASEGALIKAALKALAPS